MKSSIDFRSFASVSKRRSALEKELRVELPQIGVFSDDEEVASKRNCENMVGTIHVPLGIAGPLLVHGDEINGDVFVPLATTEGALVASVSRGCKAITLSGGAGAYAYKVGTTRGPVFFTGSLKKSREVQEWIRKHEGQLKRIAEKTSNHIIYKKVMVKGTSDYVFARFLFETSDAMGMNMVTIATQQIVDLVERETGVACLSLAGNFDIDKKPAWLNVINSRGIQAWAEATIKKSIVRDILKTTPQQFVDVWLGKCMLGSAMSGSLGFNAHFANIIAAVFIATGQDPAHVVEGSLGVTTARVLKNGDLYVSVYLPALMVGTVGGGTNLSTQKESLEILRAKGEGKVLKFAEIIAGAVLAGEVSLLASLSEGTLARSHQRLARNKTKLT